MITSSTGGGIHAGAADGLTNDNGPELRGRKGRQAAEIAADGSADGGDQDRRCGVAHGASRCWSNRQAKDTRRTGPSGEVQRSSPAAAAQLPAGLAYDLQRPAPYPLDHSRHERLHRHHLLLVAGAAHPNRDGVRLGLALPDHRHVGDLADLPLADPVVQGGVAGVERRPDPGRPQPRHDLAGRRRLLVGDRQHPDLLGREPDRERAGEVLDQDGDEPLEGAAHGAVDDHRPVLRVVLADVAEVEPLRRGVVELDGAQLPLPPDRVGDVEVDLGTVERPVPGLELVRHAPSPRARRAGRPRRGPTSRPRRSAARGGWRTSSVAVSPKVA